MVKANLNVDSVNMVDLGIKVFLWPLEPLSRAHLDTMVLEMKLLPFSEEHQLPVSAFLESAKAVSWTSCHYSVGAQLLVRGALVLP